MNHQFPDWSSFQEAREAITLMPLVELASIAGRAKPRLWPVAGWSVLGGGAVFFLAVMFDWFGLRYLGLLIVAYGLVALTVNRARASAYREGIYRAYVHNKALEMQETA